MKFIKGDKVVYTKHHDTVRVHFHRGDILTVSGQPWHFGRMYCECSSDEYLYTQSVPTECLQLCELNWYSRITREIRILWNRISQ